MVVEALNTTIIKITNSTLSGWMNSFVVSSNHSISATFAANNLTINSTTVLHKTQVSQALTSISMLVCVLVFFVGLLGNSLVLIVFFVRRRQLKACEIFMVNLAFADMLSTIVTPTLAFAETIGADFAPIGTAGCKMMHFTIITCITVCALTLIGITVDRFIIVKWPLCRRAPTKLLRIVVVCMWMLGSGPGGIYLHSDYVRLHPVENDMWHCRQWLSKDVRIKHTMTTFTVQVIVPLFLMVFLYSLITYQLWRTSRQLQSFNTCEKEVRRRYQRNKKATLLLVTIVVVFFVCITPANILYIFYLFNLTKLPLPQLIRLFTILQMLQMTNSCVNPIIYSRLHNNFRNTISKIFCRSCMKKKENNYEVMRRLDQRKATASEIVPYCDHTSTCL